MFVDPQFACLPMLRIGVFVFVTKLPYESLQLTL